MRARRDGIEEARELAQQAVKLASATDSLSFHGWAVLDLAQVEALLNGGAPPPELVAEAMSCSHGRRTQPRCAGPRLSSQAPASPRSAPDGAGTPAASQV